MSTGKVPLSLQDYRIALTLAADDPISPAAELLDREAALYYYPVSQTLPSDHMDALEDSLRQCAAGTMRWLLLPTPCAVVACWETLVRLNLAAEALQRAKIALYGAKTQLAFAHHFPTLHPARVAADSHLHMVEMLDITPGDRVVVPVAQRTRVDWPTLLASSGAEVLAPPAYRLLLGRGGDDLPGLLWGGLVDAVVFFTENSVRHFMIRLKAEGGTGDMLHHVVVAALDAPTAQAAQAYGIPHVVLPTESNFAALAEALAASFAVAAPLT
jgi:uroporphyrinogen-III synthase